MAAVEGGWEEGGQEVTEAKEAGIDVALLEEFISSQKGAGLGKEIGIFDFF